MIIRASVLINADIDRVWKTFTDLTCWESWNSVIENVSNGKPEVLAKGGQLKFCIRPFALPVSLEAEVDEVVPGKKIVWLAKKLWVLARHEFLFENSADGVTVTSIEKFSGLRLALAGFLLSKGRLLSLTTTLLDELKKASESPANPR